MNSLPRELIAQFGNFLSVKDIAACRLAAKVFAPIGDNVVSQVFPWQRYDDTIDHLEIARIIKKCKPRLRDLIIKVENTSHVVDLAPIIQEIRIELPDIPIKVFMVNCSYPDMIMDRLPKHDKNIDLYIEWLLTNIDRPRFVLRPQLMTSHPINMFVAEYVKDWSILTHDAFVNNIENLVIGDGGHRIDLSHINPAFTKSIKYNLVYYPGSPEVIDAFKITGIHVKWDHRPPTHILNSILAYPQRKICLREIRSSSFFHFTWIDFICRLPATIKYIGTISTPIDIFMMDYFHRSGRNLVIRVSNMEQYRDAVAAKFITGYNNIPIDKVNDMHYDTTVYRSIEDLWASMSASQRAMWGVLQHVGKK